MASNAPVPAAQIYLVRNPPLFASIRPSADVAAATVRRNPYLVMIAPPEALFDEHFHMLEMHLQCRQRFFGEGSERGIVRLGGIGHEQCDRFHVSAVLEADIGSVEILAVSPL